MAISVDSLAKWLSICLRTKWNLVFVYELSRPPENIRKPDVF